MVMSDDPSKTYTEGETRERAERTLKAMLATPHKPHKVKKGADPKARP